MHLSSFFLAAPALPAQGVLLANAEFWIVQFLHHSPSQE